jgi:hypothetical protein
MPLDYKSNVGRKKPAPIAEGGTSGTSAGAARQNLEVVGIDDILDANGKILTSKFQTQSGDKRAVRLVNGKLPINVVPRSISAIATAITGPKTAASGSSSTYFITNHDSFTTYNIEVENGSFSRTGANLVVYWNPGPSGVRNIKINGSTFPVNVTGGVIAKPVIQTPLDGSKGVSVDYTFTSGTFAVSPAGWTTVKEAQWEISTDHNFVNNVIRHTVSGASYNTLSQNELERSLVYFVRVRYVGNNDAVSEWSDVRHFATEGLLEGNRVGAVTGLESSTIGLGSKVVLSLDSRLMAVSAPDSSSGRGEVSLYLRNGVNWSRIGLVKGTSEAAHSRFGESIDMSPNGKYLAVGTPGDNSYGENSGSVSIYEITDTGLTLTRKIISNNPSTGENFGKSLAFSKDNQILVVGAPGSNAGYEGSGAAYVFMNDEDNWDQSEVLTPDAGPPFTGFGESVAVSNDCSIILVGAPNYSNSRGGVYLFADENGTYVRKSVTVPSSFQGAKFGTNVSISGEGNVFAGSTQASGEGSEAEPLVYVYNINTNTKAVSLRASITSPILQEGAGVGSSLDFSNSGDVFIVGCPNLPTADEGLAYVYSDDGAGGYNLSLTLNAGAGVSVSAFGTSVALSNFASVIAVGAPRGAGSKGMSHIFR